MSHHPHPPYRTAAHGQHDHNTLKTRKEQIAEAKAAKPDWDEYERIKKAKDEAYKPEPEPEDAPERTLALTDDEKRAADVWVTAGLHAVQPHPGRLQAKQSRHPNFGSYSAGRWTHPVELGPVGHRFERQ